MTAHARRDDRGFSLTELVVVIAIIGVLAAVAVPLYLDHQAKANDAAAQSDAMNLGKLIRAAYDESPDEAVDVDVNAGGTGYTINGQPALGASPGVELVRWRGDSIEEWCVQLRHAGGRIAANPGVRFDSHQGYVENAACG